jgi:hypothetical protein
MQRRINLGYDRQKNAGIFIRKCLWRLWLNYKNKKKVIESREERIIRRKFS